MTAQKCTLRHKYRACVFWVCLTTDNAINFTTRSSSLVMDLQYVANEARQHEKCDGLSSGKLIWNYLLENLKLWTSTTRLISQIFVFIVINVINVLKLGYFCLFRNVFKSLFLHLEHKSNFQIIINFPNLFWNYMISIQFCIRNFKSYL